MIAADLFEAREIVKATLAQDSHRRCNCREKINAGEWDEGQKVRAALAGIKRGRALALSCRCPVCASDMRGLTPCMNEES
ncbi:hypothetical protein ADT71_09630 [Novosphingobium sp. ST904]|nr:hypothetical protein ADT71_09630 [Novosphingobium sp. ST904]TCM29069.1 hypothetical protein EDF59_1283 [Novosphingobium sp. ST904]